MISLKTILENSFFQRFSVKRDVTLELTEICEIAEKMINRMENKLKILKRVEAQMDQKIAILDGLMTRMKHMNMMDESAKTPEKNSPEDVRSLAGKGFKPEQIARILDLPSGEVELILNLVH